MKSILSVSSLCAALCMSLAPAATPEQEKAFVETYKKALDAGDAKALNALLITDGAEPETIEFFKMMQAPEPGAKVASIELVTPTAEEAAKYAEAMPMPNGKEYKLPLKPYKQLVIKTETKTADGSSSSTSQVPIVEKNGKLGIPVPVPAKAAAAPKGKK